MLRVLMDIIKLLKLLLAAGVNKETPKNDGAPLHVACGHPCILHVYMDTIKLSNSYSNVALILMLLNAGASIYQQNRNGLALLQDPNIHQEYRDILYEHHRNISLFNLLWPW